MRSLAMSASITMTAFTMMAAHRKVLFLHRGDHEAHRMTSARLGNATLNA
jgi:hypothetical protein